MEGRGISPLCMNPLDMHHLSITLQYLFPPCVKLCMTTLEMEHYLPTNPPDPAQFGCESATASPQFKVYKMRTRVFAGSKCEVRGP